MKVENEQVTTFIFKAVDYFDEHGRHIQERVPVVGKPPEGFHRFIARGSLKLMSRGGVTSREFWSTIPAAKSAADAFKMADEHLKADGKKIKDNMLSKTKKIITAPGGMLDGSGNLVDGEGPKKPG